MTLASVRMREPRTLVAPAAHDFGAAAMDDDNRERLLARFWPKVNKDGPGGCWLWTGHGSRGGGKRSGGKYGRLYVSGKFQGAAHRVSYELFVGQIPDGLTIDHVVARGCTSTLCVNPDHLEAVTHRENVLRGSSPCAIRARSDTCLSGHNEWRIRRDGARRCIPCERDRLHRAWLAILASRPAARKGKGKGKRTKRHKEGMAR